MTYDQAARQAKQEKRDYDRLLYAQNGKPYGFIPVRNGRALPPREIARALIAQIEGEQE